MKIGKLRLKLFGKGMSNAEAKALKGVVFDRSENTIFDIPYASENDERLKFDLLKAKEEKRKNVLIIDVHGGAYYHGHRVNNYKFCNVFREVGYDVVVADYRLTDAKKGYSVESEIRDLLTMLSFIQENKEKYGLSTERLVVMGDSAGGHFALLLSEILQSKELQKEWGVDLSGLSLKATVVSCPVYDFAGAVYASGMRKSGSDYMYGKGWENEEWTKKLDPRVYLASLHGPVFVSSCQNDFLKAHAILLDKELTENRCDHTFCFLETTDKKSWPCSQRH